MGTLGIVLTTVYAMLAVFVFFFMPTNPYEWMLDGPEAKELCPGRETY